MKGEEVDISLLSWNSECEEEIQPNSDGGGHGLLPQGALGLLEETLALPCSSQTDGGDTGLAHREPLVL